MNERMNKRRKKKKERVYSITHTKQEIRLQKPIGAFRDIQPRWEDADDNGVVLLLLLLILFIVFVVVV